MKITIAVFVAILAMTCGFAAEADGAVCKPFIERNETCRDSLLGTCTVVLKAKMLEQIAAAPEEMRGEMSQGLDAKVLEFCNGFINQVTGERALKFCTEKMSGDDPATAAQLDNMNTCLAKETCTAYAECAVKFD